VFKKIGVKLERRKGVNYFYAVVRGGPEKKRFLSACSTGFLLGGGGGITRAKTGAIWCFTETRGNVGANAWELTLNKPMSSTEKGGRTHP